MKREEKFKNEVVKEKIFIRLHVNDRPHKYAHTHTAYMFVRVVQYTHTTSFHI